MPILSGTELMIFITAILLASFVLGWIARWMFDRLNTNGPIANEEAVSRMTIAEEALEAREREFAATEAQYANAYAQLEADLEAAMSGLGEARRELREYKAAHD